VTDITAGSIPDNPDDHLEEMRIGFAVRSEAQQLAANNAGTRHSRFSAAATIFAAIGGTSAFVSLSTSADEVLVVLAATLSLAAAVFSDLQVHLNYSNRVADHRKWAAVAGAQARRISFAQGNRTTAELAERRFLDFLRELQTFDTDAPQVSRDLWVAGRQEVLSRTLRGERRTPTESEDAHPYNRQPTR
jgi:hypothetical protein